MKIGVSVVVPTCKRPDLLNRCLEALTAQRFESTAYEILIVDDAPCADTQRLVERWSRRVEQHGYTLRYLPVVGAHGPAAARNTGWRAAHGECIAFTDDDCIPTPGWLAAGMAALMRGADAVSGQIVVPLDHTPSDYERNAAHLEQAEFVTANCFYRRSVLEAVGGFDERFTSAWREDSDLFFTLLERHARCERAPEAIVYHPVRPARWGISLRQQRKSMFNALLYKKHPTLYRQRIQASPPWRYYAIVATLLLALISCRGAPSAPLWLPSPASNARRQCGRPGRRPLTLIALSGWLLLTGHFCLQRLRATSHTPRHVSEMLLTSLLIPPLAIYWRLRGAFKFRVFFF